MRAQVVNFSLASRRSPGSGRPGPGGGARAATRGNRPGPGPDLQEAPVRVVAHHHPARVASQAPGRSAGTCAPSSSGPARPRMPGPVRAAGPACAGRRRPRLRGSPRFVEAEGKMARVAHEVRVCGEHRHLVAVLGHASSNVTLSVRSRLLARREHGELARQALAGSSSGGQSAMADSVPVDYGDRMFEIKPASMSEDAVQKRQHLVIRIGSASEEDDARAGGLTDLLLR